MRGKTENVPVTFTPLHWLGSLLAAFREESYDAKQHR